MDKVKVYGAGWCEDTQKTREYLDRIGVNYEYLDVDADPVAKEWSSSTTGESRKRRRS
ncbi:MAG: hypothetical protein M3478_06035 [Planctomycetota bacterium]|nr:hypothetical protein [Planctomycetota bacterium]